MLVTLAGMVIEVRPAIPLNAKSFIPVTVFSKITTSPVVKLLVVISEKTGTQFLTKLARILTVIFVIPEKMEFPINITLSGIVTLISLVHPEKAEFPILDTLSGMVMEVSPVKPLKADSFIPVTVFSKITTSPVVKPVVVILEKTGLQSLIKFDRILTVIFVMPEKTAVPILIIFSDMVKFASLVHPEKALSPMLVTLDGMVMEVNPARPLNAESSILLDVLSRTITSPVVKPVTDILEKTGLQFLIVFVRIVAVRLVTPEKTAVPILLTFAGIVIEFSLVHPEKTEFPILLTLPGMFMAVSPEHPIKAESPMEVKPDIDMETVTSLVQS